MRSSPLFLFPVALALGGSLLAQEFTSPAGFLTKEGAHYDLHMLFSQYEMRWQAIDRSNLGKPLVINSVAWRRDFDLSTGQYGVRTLTGFQFIMANANYLGLQKGYLLDKNYKGTPTTVIDACDINSADWRTKPTVSPAPWDNNLNFDRPFVYTGMDALLWEVRYTANTAAGADYPFDFDYAGGQTDRTGTSGKKVGTSCTATGQTSAIYFWLSVENHEAPKFLIQGQLTRLPARAPVVMSIDVMDQNLTIPGLCTTVHAGLLVLLGLGQSDYAGQVREIQIDNIPYAKSLVGVDLWFQAWSIDAGQPGLPLVLSHALKVTVPPDPPMPTSVTRFANYRATSTSSGTLGGPWFGGVITKFSR